MERIAKQVTKDLQPLRPAIEHANQQFAEYNKQILTQSLQDPALEVHAQFARRIADSLSPLAVQHRQIAEQLAAAWLPMVQVQEQLAAALAPTRASMEAIARQMQPLVDLAITLEVGHGSTIDSELDAEIDLIEQLLGDGDSQDLFEQDTRDRWSNMSAQQRRLVARIVSFILHAVGGVFLTLLGQPWLIAVLSAVIGAVTETVTGKIEEAP